jgi:hypothetical protein
MSLCFLNWAIRSSRGLRDGSIFNIWACNRRRYSASASLRRSLAAWTSGSFCASLFTTSNLERSSGDKCFSNCHNFSCLVGVSPCCWPDRGKTPVSNATITKPPRSRHLAVIIPSPGPLSLGPPVRARSSEPLNHASHCLTPNDGWTVR